MFTGINTEVIPEQTESLEVKDILQTWDVQINVMILSAFLHGQNLLVIMDCLRLNRFPPGFYTGVMSIALWTIGLYLLHLCVLPL